MKHTRVPINPDCVKCGKVMNIMSISVDISGVVYLLNLKWYCPYCQEETDGSTSFEHLCVQAQCAACKTEVVDDDDKWDKMLRDMDDEVEN